MRIALITDGIWPYVLGGMQKHSYYLCKYLAKNKIHVDLVHFNRSNYNVSGLDCFTPGEKEYITSIIVDFPQTAKFPGHYIYQSYLHSKLIFNALKDKLDDYDFIYTKGFTGWYLIEQKRKHAVTKTPVAVKFHGYEMFQRPPSLKISIQNSLLLRKPVRQLSQQADFVFSYGGKITDIIRSLGVAPERVIELPSGVEEDILVNGVRHTALKIKFLFLGRYERRKGIEELNEAIGDLATGSFADKMAFHFIGPIPENKKIANRLVTYHGEIRDKQQLQNLIQACDVLICPSWSEGMPNVILEAMANALAVVATDVGANNVLVNDKTGWLLESGSAADIVSCIGKIMKLDMAEIDTKKAGALVHIRQNFTWEKLILKFCNNITQRIKTP